jgi:hypothetical protein
MKFAPIQFIGLVGLALGCAACPSDIPTPTKCNTGEFNCPMFDTDMCMIGSMCQSMTNGKGLDGKDCMASCPMACSNTEMVCGGAQDENGCQMPGMCMPVPKDAPCPVNCPAACQAGERMCPGGMDPAGKCMMQDSCMSTKMPCPVNCAGDMLPCPGYVAEWGPKEGHCIPMSVKGTDGDCPNMCQDMPCGKDSWAIAGIPDPKGCPTPPTCSAPKF